MRWPTGSGAMADSPQLKARSVLTVGMDYVTSESAVARTSAAIPVRGTSSITAHPSLFMGL